MRLPKQQLRLNNQDNNSARALHFLVHFFSVTAQLDVKIPDNEIQNYQMNVPTVLLMLT